MKRFFPWAALIALGLSALLTQAILFKQVVQGHTDLTRQLPEQLGDWVTVQTFSPSPQEIRGLETQDMIRRVYSNGRLSVELVVAYIAHSSRKSAHAQEACLRGAGALVSQIDDIHFETPAISGKRIHLQFQNHKQWVLYFYKIGDLYTADYLWSSWLMFFGGLAGKEQKGTALIRLTTPEYPGESLVVATERLRQFSELIIPTLQATLP